MCAELELALQTTQSARSELQQAQASLAIEASVCKEQLSAAAVAHADELQRLHGRSLQVWPVIKVGSLAHLVGTGTQQLPAWLSYMAYPASHQTHVTARPCGAVGLTSGAQAEVGGSERRAREAGGRPGQSAG
jgi:hypothetical protein